MADYNINAITRRVVFTGSAGLGPYAFSFEILDENDVAVYFNTTKLTLTTDYTVTINANGTGSVTIVTGTNVPSTPTASDQIIIVGARDIERVTDFVTAGDLLASSLNEQLDALTIFDQQVAEENRRGLRAPVYDPALVEDGGTLDMTLPAKADRAGKYLQFNSTTGNPEAGPDSADVTAIADIATDIATLADIEDGTDATDAIQTVAGISSNVTTVAGIAANVSTVAGNTSNINAVAADATDIGTVATNIASVNTVAGNISEVVAVANDLNEAVSEVETVANDLNEAVSEIETVAASISNVDSVGTNISNVNTVAGISSNVTTVAGISGDVTTVSGISGNVTTVGGISGNVTTVAGIASNVTTVAGINADVTAVAADATDIGTVATNIANVNAVGGDIANVNTVAGNLAGVNSFAERYRVGATDPTTSLDEGDLFFNTTDNTYKFYDGSTWQVVNVTGIAELSEDTTPQLGGNLDLNSNDITGTGNIDVTGTLSANNIRVGVALDSWGANSHVLQMGDAATDTGALAWNTVSGADYFDLMYQSYFDGTNYKYTTAAAASRISQRNGSITFDRKAAGTADATFTWDNSLTISSSGDVGIGTSSPSAKAHIQTASSGSTVAASGDELFVEGSGDAGITVGAGNTSKASLFFADNGDSAAGRIRYDHSDNSMQFGTNGQAERLRIDSSGNLLVGTTDTSPWNNTSGTGILASSGGVLAATASGDAAFYGNRLGTDGDIIQLRKSGITVGSVGTANSGDLYIGNDDTTLLFAGGSDAILPRGTAGATRDGAIDLGLSAHRFKDLYLSGDALVGTTTNYAGGNGSGLIAKANATAALCCSRTGDNGATARFFRDNTLVGSISVTGSATAYNTSSDYRLKENVTADWDATTRLKQLNPVRFNFISDADTTVDGFLAHEVQDIVPEAISGTKDGMRDEEYEVTPAVLDEDGNEVTPAVMGTRSVPDYQGIDQSKLVPLLVKTIQELEARIAALEAN